MDLRATRNLSWNCSLNPSLSECSKRCPVEKLTLFGLDAVDVSWGNGTPITPQREWCGSDFRLDRINLDHQTRWLKHPTMRQTNGYTRSLSKRPGGPAVKGAAPIPGTPNAVRH